MRKLLLFKADWSEVNKYRRETGTNHGASFYSIANAGTIPFLTNTIAEYYDCSGKPIPTPGYRLTETVPEDPDSFRDSGWEVIEVEEYTPEIPAPYGAKFDSICICYCIYKPLPPEDEWTKKKLIVLRHLWIPSAVMRKLIKFGSSLNQRKLKKSL